MRILFLGDIVGRVGRVGHLDLPDLAANETADRTIVATGITTRPTTTRLTGPGFSP